VLLIRDLPLKDTDTLGFIYSTNAQLNSSQAPVPAADFLDYREEVSAFAEIAAVDRGAAFTLTGSEEPVWIEGFLATANTLDVWRQTTFMGRWFTEQEDREGGDRVAVLSHGSWERRFGFDPDILGRVINLDGYPTTVIGVMPKEMEFGSLADAEVWVPARLNRATASRENRTLWVIGRLDTGASLAQAQQEVDAVRRRIIAEEPALQGPWGAIVYDMHRALAPPDTWTIMFMLGLTVTFVMLIACSNVATMMLTRASARSREIAVRAALGAQRSRLLGQLLGESAILSLAAGALGLLIARASLLGLIWMAGENSGMDIFGIVTLDRTVLLFTLGVALVSPLLFGFVPALRASRPDLNETLSEGARGSSGGPGGLRGRRFLVATQVALALSLMVVAGLLMQAMANNRNYDPGFDVDRLMTMRVDLSESKFPTGEGQLEQFSRVRAALEAVPGVQDVTTMGWRLGANDDPVVARSFRIEGQPEPDAAEMPSGFLNVVSAGTLAAMQLPLRSGRDFTESDNVDTAPVAIINEDLADRYWTGDPVGSRIRLGAEDRWLEVVGVMANIHSGDSRQPAFPIIFTPLAQNPQRQMGILARTAGDPLAMTTALREAIWSVDSDQPVADMRTVDQLIEDSFAAPMTLFSIFAAFAAFAVAMSAAGIYGVISYAVSARTREIGIRMALGARATSVLAMITRQALWLVALGMMVGSATGLFLGRLLSSAIPDVGGFDLPSFLGVLAVFVATTLLATWIPARRAARVQPVTALRTE
jgi:putative ABC transport system permease protein